MSFQLYKCIQQASHNIGLAVLPLWPMLFNITVISRDVVSKSTSNYYVIIINCLFVLLKFENRDFNNSFCYCHPSYNTISPTVELDFMATIFSWFNWRFIFYKRATVS